MPVFTTASQGQCMHGGTLLLLTTNTMLLAEGCPVLLESDIHIVAGCPFTVGVVYTPCVTVEWKSAETSLSVMGAKVLTDLSVGKCLNAAQAPQGLAIMNAPAAVLEAL